MASAILATTTLARFEVPFEAVRARCILRTIELGIQHGYQIVCVDGGSPAHYIERMQRLGAQVFTQEKPGMGNARRQALRQARDLSVDPDQIITWLEPEKYPLVPLLRLPLQVMTDVGYELVILRRQSLASYPPEQAMAYQLISLAVKYLTGIESDFGWGPCLLNLRAVEYFIQYQSQHGDRWDSVHCPKLQIIHAGLPWTIVELPYVHPPEQSAAETGMPFFRKRLDQVHHLVNALEDEATRLGMRI
jgi:hypothetical protein